MTKAKLSKVLGKRIRKETGLPLPIAMKAGKFLARNREREFPYVLRDYMSDGSLIGPKGEVPILRGELYVDHYSIFDIEEFLA